MWLSRVADERGSSESVQWAVLTPLLVLLVIGTIQSGIWLHGRTVAQEAAAAGAEAVAAGAPVEEATAVAQRVATGLTDIHVSVRMSDKSVTVSVEGRTQTFLDLGQGRVEAAAEQPRERR